MAAITPGLHLPTPVNAPPPPQNASVAPDLRRWNPPRGTQVDLDEIKRWLNVPGATADEKMRFLQSIVDHYKNEPDKNETTTKFTNLLEDFMDNTISPKGRNELESMLGIDLNTLKGEHNTLKEVQMDIGKLENR